MDNLLGGSSTYDQYANAPDQSDVAPNLNSGGVGTLPAMWIVGVIIALVIIRILQPYAEK